MTALPTFHDEPMASLRAVMIFPNDLIKAANYAAWCLARGSEGRVADVHAIGIDRFHKIALGAAAHSRLEADQNAFSGGCVGVVVITLLALMTDNPALASWNRAVKVAAANASHARGRSQTPVSAAALRSRLAEFAPVLHLWGAWSARGSRWRADPSVGYSHYDDYQRLLCEGEAILETLRKWNGQKNRNSQSKYLLADFFQVPPDWIPPRPQAGWPRTGAVPKLVLDYAKMPNLAPMLKAGRPRGKPVQSSREKF
jgi:hypothetical protein